MPRSTCGACNKMFSSTTAFDHHRIGGWGEPIYESERKRKNHEAATHFTPHTRRCMTDDEMRANGFAVERKPITITRDGRDFQEEHDVWYEPEAREKLRQAYQSDEGDE